MSGVGLAACFSLAQLFAGTLRQGGAGMLLDSVRNWFGGAVQDAGPTRAPAAELAGPSSACSSPEPPVDWPPARIAVVESLWGEGFLFPGGEEETLRP